MNKAILSTGVVLFILCSCSGSLMVNTNWLSTFPIDDGSATLRFGKIKLYPGGIYASSEINIKLDNKPERIGKFNLLSFNGELRFYKKGHIFKKMQLPVKNISNNTELIKDHIWAHINFSDSDWDTWNIFIENEKKSDRIEYSISLKFEANNIPYSVHHEGELEKIVDREWTPFVE